MTSTNANSQLTPQNPAPADATAHAIPDSSQLSSRALPRATPPLSLPSSAHSNDADIDQLLHDHAAPERSDGVQSEGQTALLVLSRDPAVIDTVRRAAPRGCIVADAFDIDMAADKMAKVRPGVLVADKDVVADVGGLVAQFTQHFPDLVVVVAGRRDDSAALMQLTATGHIHRFLLLPLSHGQSRLALDAAVKQHLELTAAGKRATSGGTGSGQKNYLPAYLGLAAALVVMLAGIWWGVGRLMNTDTAASKPAPVAQAPAVDPRVEALRKNLLQAKQSFDAQHYVDPTEGSALEAYRGVLIADPNNAEAVRGLHDITDKMLERAETALLAEHLEDAVSAVALARSIQPDHPRLTFLDAQIAHERERLSLTQAKDTVVKVRRLLAQASSQSEGNARDTLLEARRLDPTDPAVAQALRSLEDRIADSNAHARLIAQSEAQGETAAGGQPASAQSPRAASSQLQPAPATTTAPAASPTAQTNSAKVTGSTATNTPPASPAPAATVAAYDDLVPVTSLQRTRMVTPTYPESARSKGIEGWVNVEFKVMTDGKVADVKVVEASPANVFDEAAIKAVRGWRFEPVKKDGAPVIQHTMVRLKFTM